MLFSFSIKLVFHLDSASSTSLPTQCTSYTSLSDITRLTSYTSCVNCFWDTSPYFSTGWYRFIAPGGTQMPAMPP
ncbi:unnamed protein product, partial [Rotaria magnacalcarata]